MIIWTGHGILIPLFVIIGFALGFITGLGIGGAVGSEKTAMALGTMFGGAGLAGMLWLYARTIGKTEEKLLVDPSTGAPTILKKSHSLFFIPAFAWAVIGTVVAGFMVLVAVFTLFMPEPDPTEIPPGAEALSEAESLIASQSGGRFHGNTREAMEMAESFSVMTSELRSFLIEEGKPSRFSTSGGNFLSYCQVSDHGVAFLVRVPDLRNFTDEAKEVMGEAAWIAADRVVSEMTTPPDEMAVAIRGVVSYESVMLGAPGRATEDSTQIGIRERKQEGVKEALLPFFAGIDLDGEVDGELGDGTGEAEEQEAPDKGTDDGEAELAQSEDEDNSIGAEEAAGTGDAPLLTDAPTEEESDEPGADAQMEPEDAGTDEVAEMVTGDGNDSETGEEEMVGEDTDEVTAVLPTEQRQWTSSDGRSMVAALVKFVGLLGEQVEFERQDGELFTVPLERFSDESKAELRELFMQVKQEGQ